MSIIVDKLTEDFMKHGGVLKSSELNELGFTSKQINNLVEQKQISKIKHGFYESSVYPPQDEVIISRLFPDAVIFLESAAFYYDYIDRIPTAWQIAVDKDSNKIRYNIDYPLIDVYYFEGKFVELGVNIVEIDGVEVRFYDKDRTICDFLRYEKKLDNEVFTQAIKNYVSDTEKNVRQLYEYARVLNIVNKVQTYIGMWL